MQTLDLVRLLGAGLSLIFALARACELLWEVLSDRRKAAVLNRVGDWLSGLARTLDEVQLGVVVVAARLWQRAERLEGREFDVDNVVDAWRGRRSQSSCPPSPAPEPPPLSLRRSKRRKD